MNVLTQRELNEKKCPHGCGNHSVILSKTCHPASGWTIAYDHETGQLHLYCFDCHAEANPLLIAEHALT